jgi:hypothetical protein
MNSSYAPYYGDEFFYYKNAEAFSKISSLKAVFSYSGSGSEWLGFDPHGPAYPLVYGIIGKLFGWFGPLIPFANICILLVSLVFLFRQKHTCLSTKFLEILLVLGSPICLFYSFSFMPELIQLAAGVLLFLMFRGYYEKPSRRSLFFLMLLILVLGIIRSTWFFAFAGLSVYPNRINWKAGLGFLFIGLSLSYVSQVFLHESVLNTFTEIGDSVESKTIGSGIAILFTNLERNIYFALNYTEGKFYTLQKIWGLATIIIALLGFRNEKIIQSGLLIFGLTFLFNMFMYKNYSWVDLRMYNPMLIFINLGMLNSNSHRRITEGLLVVELISFILIFPLSHTIINYRSQSELKDIDEATKELILTLEQPLILIDTLVLKDYALDQLPISNQENQPIRYILPYYDIQMLKPSHQLAEQEGQLKVNPVNILSQ